MTTESQSVKFYGAVGDGVADDGPSILNAFVANLGGRTYFPPGQYRVATGALNVTMSDDLIIDSQNASLVVDHSGSPTFGFNGEIVSEPNLVGSLSRGEMSLTVDVATGIDPGDILVLISGTVWETQFNYTNRETHIVKSVSGTVVVLTEPIVFGYAEGVDGVEIKVSKPHRLTITGALEIRYATGATARCIDLFRLQGSELSGLRIIDPQRRKTIDPVFLGFVVDTTIRDASIEGAQYGFNINSGSRNTNVLNVTSQYCRHPIDFNTGCVDCYIDGLIGRANNSTLSCHPCFNFQARNVTAREDTDGFNHRSVGGRIENYSLVTAEAVTSGQMQNVELVNNVYPEYEFQIDGFYVAAPNAAARPRVSANENGKRATFNDLSLAYVSVGTAGSVDLTVSNSIFQSIRFRGGRLMLSNVVFDYEAASPDNRVENAMSLTNTVSLQGINVCVTGDYAAVVSDYFMEDFSLVNLEYGSQTALMSGSGSGGKFSSDVRWSKNG